MDKQTKDLYRALDLLRMWTGTFYEVGYVSPGYRLMQGSAVMSRTTSKPKLAMLMRVLAKSAQRKATHLRARKTA